MVKVLLEPSVEESNDKKLDNWNNEQKYVTISVKDIIVICELIGDLNDTLNLKQSPDSWPMCFLTIKTNLSSVFQKFEKILSPPKDLKAEDPVTLVL